MLLLSGVVRTYFEKLVKSKKHQNFIYKKGNQDLLSKIRGTAHVNNHFNEDSIGIYCSKDFI